MAKTNLGRVIPLPKGEYSASAAYNHLDFVSYEGASYICKAACTGKLPTDAAYWQLMSSRGKQGVQGQDGKVGPQGPQGPSGYTGAADELEVVQTTGSSSSAVMSQDAVSKELNDLALKVGEIVGGDEFGTTIPATEFTQTGVYNSTGAFGNSSAYVRYGKQRVDGITRIDYVGNSVNNYAVAFFDADDNFIADGSKIIGVPQTTLITTGSVNVPSNAVTFDVVTRGDTKEQASITLFKKSLGLKEQVDKNKTDIEGIKIEAEAVKENIVKLQEDIEYIKENGGGSSDDVVITQTTIPATEFTGVNGYYDNSITFTASVAYVSYGKHNTNGIVKIDYIGSANGNWSILFFDANDNFISNGSVIINSGSTVKVATGYANVPSNAATFDIVTRNSLADLSSITLTKKESPSNDDDRIEKIEQEIDRIKEAISGENKTDQYTEKKFTISDFSNYGYIDASGDIFDATAYSHTDFIKILPNTTKVKYYGNSLKNAAVAFYSEDKTYLSAESTNSASTAVYAEKEISVPENAGYLIAVTRTDKIESYLVVEYDTLELIKEDLSSVEIELGTIKETTKRILDRKSRVSGLQYTVFAAKEYFTEKKVDIPKQGLAKTSRMGVVGKNPLSGNIIVSYTGKTDEQYSDASAGIEQFCVYTPELEIVNQGLIYDCRLDNESYTEPWHTCNWIYNGELYYAFANAKVESDVRIFKLKIYKVKSDDSFEYVSSIKTGTWDLAGMKGLVDGSNIYLPCFDEFSNKDSGIFKLDMSSLVSAQLFRLHGEADGTNECNIYWTPDGNIAINCRTNYTRRNVFEMTKEGIVIGRYYGDGIETNKCMESWTRLDDGRIFRTSVGQYTISGGFNRNGLWLWGSLDEGQTITKLCEFLTTSAGYGYTDLIVDGNNLLVVHEGVSIYKIGVRATTNVSL